MAGKEEINPWQSARLTYRAIEPEDEAFVHELEAHPASFINSQPALKRPQSRADTKKSFDNHVNDSLVVVIICVTSEDMKPIGTIGLEGLTPDFKHHRYSELGLGLLPSEQGKGYGSEAIRWALQWGFESAGLHRISVKAFEYNPGAMRLYERLGFKHERTVRETWWHDGRFWADMEYGMLESEWRALREEKAKTDEKVIVQR